MKISISFGLFFLLLALFPELPEADGYKGRYCRNTEGLTFSKNRLHKGGKNVKPSKFNEDGTIIVNKAGKMHFRIPPGVKSFNITDINIEGDAEVAIGPIYCKGKKRPCQMMSLKNGVSSSISDIKLPRKKNKILVIQASCKSREPCYLFLKFLFDLIFRDLCESCYFDFQCTTRFACCIKRECACKPEYKKFDDRCIPCRDLGESCEDDIQCPNNARCRNGKCVCKRGFREVRGKCR